MWSEEDDRPYYTDRPAWQGYTGLLLWAAYAQSGFDSPPYSLPESWTDDVVYQKVMADREGLRFPAILSANLWLPGDFRFCFECSNLVGDEPAVIASTSGLLFQLRQLGANPPRWSKPPLFSRFGRAQDFAPLENAARGGLAVFTSLAEKAHEHQLPILLSF